MTATASATQSTRLTFGGILRSEWIKLWTLRSTVWCCAIALFLVLIVGYFVAANTSSEGTALAKADQQAIVASGATVGLPFAVLVLSVLGVLVITGEYGTGMIRSTMAVIPKRVPALLGKGLVLAATAAVLALVAIYGTVLLQSPFFAGGGIHGNLTDPKLNAALLGGALYVVLIALMSFGIGAMLRNGAAGIATSLGLLLVVPLVLALMASLTRSIAIENVLQFLPTNAGQQLYAYGNDTGSVTEGLIHLSAVQGGLVLLGWAALAVALAAVLVRRRDV